MRYDKQEMRYRKHVISQETSLKVVRKEFYLDYSMTRILISQLDGKDTFSWRKSTIKKEAEHRQGGN